MIAIYLAFAAPVMTAAKTNLPWQIVQKSQISGIGQYDGPVVNEIIAQGPRLGRKSSLVQIIVGFEGIEVLFTVYSCTRTNIHYSNRLVFQGNSDLAASIDDIRATMVPISDVTLARCGLPAGGEQLFGDDFTVAFTDLITKYEEFERARAKAEGRQPRQVAF